MGESWSTIYADLSKHADERLKLAYEIAMVGSSIRLADNYAQAEDMTRHYARLLDHYISRSTQGWVR